MKKGELPIIIFAVLSFELFGRAKLLIQLYPT